MEQCLKGKELNRKTCRFMKKCKEGFYRNEKTFRCRKINKNTKKTNTLENVPPLSIPEKVKLYITDSKKAKSLPEPIREYLTIKYNNSLPTKLKTPRSNIIKEMFSPEKLKKASIELEKKDEDIMHKEERPKYKTVYPENYEILEEKDKKYMIFKNGGTGIMLAEHFKKENKNISFFSKKQLEKHINPPIGWYATEKYDGIRGLWTGEYMVARPTTKNKITSGKIFNYCPEWFIHLLPQGISLDGELWMGRGQFQNVAGLSNLKISDKNNKEKLDKIWKQVKYMVFDIPSEKNKPYVERIQILKKLIDDITIKYGYNCPIVYSNTTYIDSEETLTNTFKQYTDNGAEGLIIKEPNALYENKKSKFMLKIKIHEDGEAIVIGFEEGKGRLNGLLGSLKCKLKNGKTFNIGSGLNDIIRKEYNNPDSIYYIPLNSIVNFSYMEITNDGIPRHPIYRGIRTDVNKKDIL
jgi:DNA ligase-1